MSSAPTIDRGLLAGDQFLPEGLRKALGSNMVLEAIRLDACGHFWHEGEIFQNENLSRLFLKSVRQSKGGTWLLEVGKFSYPIIVEDTGYFIDRLIEPKDSSLPWVAKTSLDSEETVDFSTLEYSDSGGFYLTLASVAQEAKVLRGAQQCLEPYLVEEKGKYFLALKSKRFPLSKRLLVR